MNTKSIVLIFPFACEWFPKCKKLWHVRIWPLWLKGKGGYSHGLLDEGQVQAASRKSCRCPSLPFPHHHLCCSSCSIPLRKWHLLSTTTRPDSDTTSKATDKHTIISISYHHKKFNKKIAVTKKALTAAAGVYWSRFDRVVKNHRRRGHYPPFPHCCNHYPIGSYLRWHPTEVKMCGERRRLSCETQSSQTAQNLTASDRGRLIIWSITIHLHHKGELKSIWKQQQQVSTN